MPQVTQRSLVYKAPQRTLFIVEDLRSLTILTFEGDEVVLPFADLLVYFLHRTGFRKRRSYALNAWLATLPEHHV
jgi:hypothetical protein